MANGGTTITVTTQGFHGLAADGQVAVAGLEVPQGNAASGFFSVAVVNPVMFTYQTSVPIAAGSLLTETTLIVVANVGLPRGQTDLTVLPPPGPGAPF
jgi:hypothetical protein